MQLEGDDMVNINSISAAQSSVKLQALRIQSEHKKQEKSQARDSERRDSISEMREQLAKLDQLVKSRFVELFGDIHIPSKWEKKPWSELVTHHCFLAKPYLQ